MPAVSSASSILPPPSAIPSTPAASVSLAAPPAVAKPPVAASLLGTPEAAASVQQILMLLATLVQSLAAGSAGAAKPGPLLPGVALPASAAPVVAPASPTLTNKTADPTQKAALDKSLAAIASDPDGAKLLAAAKAKGVTIEAGDPAKAGGSFDAVVDCPACAAAAAAAAGAADASAAADAKGAGNAGNAGGIISKAGGLNNGNVIVNGVTLSNSQNGQIRVVVRDPSNIKTIVHELVHAVSTGDGNSKAEEGIADVVGSRVANRLGGAAVGGLSGDDETIFVNKQKLYPGLDNNNAIRQTLAALGINVIV